MILCLPRTSLHERVSAFSADNRQGSLYRYLALYKRNPVSAHQATNVPFLPSYVTNGKNANNRGLLGTTTARGLDKPTKVSRTPVSNAHVGGSDKVMKDTATTPVLAADAGHAW